MAVHRGRERSENGRFLCGTRRRSERAHCGYGVFIHWYQVTRFRPLEPAPVSGPDSIPIKMPPPPSLSLPLGTASKAPWRGQTARKRERKKEKERRENKESTGLPVRRHWMSGYTYRTYAVPLSATLLYVEETCSLVPPDIETYRLRIDFTRSGRCWTACE